MTAIKRVQVRRNATAWKVTFRRNRYIPTYKREDFILVVPEDRPDLLDAALRSIHHDALIDTTERLGEAVWADG